MSLFGTTDMQINQSFRGHVRNFTCISFQRTRWLVWTSA